MDNVSKVPKYVSTLKQLTRVSVLMAAVVSTHYAQSDGSTPAGAAPGAPVGSGALSKFENINPFNGHLNVHLPLLTIGGRGSLQTPMTLAIDHQWRVRATREFPKGQVLPATYSYQPEFDGGTALKPGYGPGVLVGRKTGETSTDSQSYCGDIPYDVYLDYTVGLTRLTFILPDGTEYELRDQLTGGQPKATLGQSPCSGHGAYRGRIFVSADGSASTFISDTDIYDAPDTRSGGEFSPTGNLMLRDGSKFRIENGLVRSIRDSAGNESTFTYGGSVNSPSYRKVLTVIDPLGRVVNVAYDQSDPAPYGLCDKITFKGFGGEQDQTIRISKSDLVDALRPDNPHMPLEDLFSHANGSGVVNPKVVSSVWLADGQQRYRFYYSSYLEVARVELPTGGAVEYDFAGFGDPPGDGFFGNDPEQGNSFIYRRLTERRVYSDGATLEGKTTFSADEIGDSLPGALSTVTVNHWKPGSPSATLISSQIHYFTGSAFGSMKMKRNTEYSPAMEGREYQTEYLASDGLTVLRRVNKNWQQRAPLGWWRTDHPSLSLDCEPPNDPRLVEAITTLPTLNLVSKQTFACDIYNNQTDVYDYSYGVGVPGSLVRHIHTDYLTTNSYNGIDYTGTSVHIRDLQTAKFIYALSSGAETTVAAVEFRYDEPERSVLTYDSVTGWVNPGNSAPGHQTTTRSWLNFNAGSFSTYPNGTYLETHAQYDQCGNIRHLWDARGNQSSVTYYDSFSDGIPRNTYAFATHASLPPVPFPAGQTASTITFSKASTYDFSTGHLTSITDVNGTSTTFSYSGPFNRLHQITRPFGGGSTTYEYGDEPNNVYVRTLTTQNSTQTLELVETLDGLGRPSRAFSFRGNSTYETTDTQYDEMGRNWRRSNPYLSSGPGSTVNPSDLWTTVSYDALSRNTTVTYPDNTHSTITYGAVTTYTPGTTTTVTDQANKKRRTVIDALGKIIRADEPDKNTGSLGTENSPVLSTYYTYDALGNLLTVFQGGNQLRTFVYDSLGRQISATNPEAGPINGPGTTTYKYDEVGNPLERTDPRGVVTTYAFDALHRITARSYSDGTPGVTYTYYGDSTPSLRGRLASISSSVSTNTYDSYDALGRVFSATQTTDGQTYATSYEYDYLGHLTSQTYPSGRIVTTTFDITGRESQVSGQMAGESNKTYASQLSYTPHGAVTSMQLGNGLAYGASFNSRLQTESISLAEAGTAAPKLLDLRFAYGGVSNNGSLLSQRIIVANSPGLDVTQSYGYDQLNRLTSAAEASGANVTWKQVFIYDFYGNRQFDTTQTTANVLGSNPTINANKNRIVSETNSQYSNGFSYGYDEAGNLTQDAFGQHFTYDAENQQSSFTDQDSESFTYAYDSEGKRVKRTDLDGTTILVYNILGQLIEEYADFVPPSASGTSYLTADQLGSPRIITDANGGVKARHDYLPFGGELFLGIGGRSYQQGYRWWDTIKQKFTEYPRDGETGLDYAHYRYYSNTQGRFTSVDPLAQSAEISMPQSWNKYGYCLNNPYSFTDPDGLVWLRANNDGSDDAEYIWIDDAEYAAHPEKYTNYTVANGARVRYQWGMNCPQCEGLEPGQLVELNADSSISPVVEASVTISIREEDQLAVESITRLVGGEVGELDIVKNTTGTSFGDARKRLQQAGFDEYYFDYHPEHWGGDDYQGKVRGNWYHVTLGRPPDKVQCLPQCRLVTDPKEPWTFLQMHWHYLPPKYHWVEYVPWP